MTFGEQYPEKPPRVRFTSEVFHPNVYSDGTLCMDIIQDQWSPIHNVCTLLTSIQSLLTDPNPSSPATRRLHSCSRRTRASTTGAFEGWRRRRSRGDASLALTRRVGFLFGIFLGRRRLSGVEREVKWARASCVFVRAVFDRHAWEQSLFLRCSFNRLE